MANILPTPFNLYYIKYSNDLERKAIEKFRDITPAEQRIETLIKVGTVTLGFPLIIIGILGPIGIALGLNLGLGLNGIISKKEIIVIYTLLSTDGTAFSITSITLPVGFLSYNGLFLDIEGYKYQWSKTKVWRLRPEKEASHLYKDSLKDFSKHLRKTNLAMFYRHHLLSKEDYNYIKAKIVKYNAISACKDKLEDENLSLQKVINVQTTHSQELKNRLLRTNSSLQICESRIKRMEEKWAKKRVLLPLFTKAESPDPKHGR